MPSDQPSTSSPVWQARLPFYFGWAIVAIAFITMAVSVNTRTAFSLLLPPLIEEYGWQRGLVAGAFSFGFLAMAVLGPFVGRHVDRHGPRPVIWCGVALIAGGLFLAPMVTVPWQLYATLGLMVGIGVNLMSFMVQSLYLPNWFVRRRGLAISIAFSGVGVGAVVLLPWLQTIIEREGWRTSCWVLGLLVVLLVGPLTFFVRSKPEELGLRPDGASHNTDDGAPDDGEVILDPAWAATEWTLARALCTQRFWWIVLGYFCAIFAWYAVQVHQTKYLVDVGFTPLVAAWALGFVAVVAVPGQIGLGALSDRIGREWIWTAGCLGFAICYAALIVLEHNPSQALLYLMVISQGFLGYALTSVMGPIVKEIFDGPHFGIIFGTVTAALIAGGAAGPTLTGLIYDLTGSYRPAFLLAIAGCAVSAVAVWIAAPRKIRPVGRAA